MNPSPTMSAIVGHLALLLRARRLRLLVGLLVREVTGWRLLLLRVVLHTDRGTGAVIGRRRLHLDPPAGFPALARADRETGGTAGLPVVHPDPFAVRLRHAHAPSGPDQFVRHTG